MHLPALWNILTVLRVTLLWLHLTWQVQGPAPPDPPSPWVQASSQVDNRCCGLGHLSLLGSFRGWDGCGEGHRLGRETAAVPVPVSSPLWLVKLEILAVTPLPSDPVRAQALRTPSSQCPAWSWWSGSQHHEPCSSGYILPVEPVFLFHLVSCEDSYWSTYFSKAFSRCSLIHHIHSWLPGHWAWDWSPSPTWFPILSENTLPLPPGVPFPVTPVTSPYPPGPPFTLTSHPPRRPPCSRLPSLPSPLNDPFESWFSH